MKVKVYRYHTDPGHGWLAVKRKELAELEIADKITPYSYVKGDSVYLEEDCDMATFFNAYRSRFGRDPEYKQSYRENNGIRGFERYKVETV